MNFSLDFFVADLQQYYFNEPIKNFRTKSNIYTMRGSYFSRDIFSSTPWCHTTRRLSVLHISRAHTNSFGYIAQKPRICLWSGRQLMKLHWTAFLDPCRSAMCVAGTLSKCCWTENNLSNIILTNYYIHCKAHTVNIWLSICYVFLPLILWLVEAAARTLSNVLASVNLVAWL